MFKDKNVLITGISGFVGSSLARCLVNEGANVVGLVNSLNKDFEGVGYCNVYFGDITNYSLLCEIISDNEIDIIYHLAAKAIVRISSKDPLNTYKTNVLGTVTLLEAVRNVGRCKKIIVASSDKAYGSHNELPYTEKHSLQPSNTYDTSKCCMDMIAQSYMSNYKLPICVTRCSNIYGPGDLNISRLIPNTIKKILDNKQPILYTNSKDMEREFIHIQDVVNAYSLLGCSNITGVFNIGGNGAMKISDVVEDISHEMKYKEHPIIEKRDSVFHEIQKQYIDASKMYEIFGWKPKIEFKDGIKDTIKWYKLFFQIGVK